MYVHQNGGKKDMLNSEVIIEADICRDVLNGLIANYARYGREKGIDLRDKKSDISKLYCMIVSESKKTRFYKTEEEVKKCNELIETAKAALEKIGESV